MAVSIKFERCGVRDGEILYRLVIGGRTVREDLTIDQVVEVINRRDEESLGAEHGVGANERNGGGRDGHDHV